MGAKEISELDRRERKRLWYGCRGNRIVVLMIFSKPSPPKLYRVWKALFLLGVFRPRSVVVDLFRVHGKLGLYVCKILG